MLDLTGSLVFVVDDDEAVLTVLSQMLLYSLKGIRVKTFKDDSFLLDPEISDLDLLIIDNNLGTKRRGVELAGDTMEKIGFSSVLIISGFDLTDEDKRLLCKLPVYDFIFKPVYEYVFANRVRLLLSGMRYMKEVLMEKEATENRFWALLKNIVGIYCVFTDSKGNILFSDVNLRKDIGLLPNQSTKDINIHDVIEGIHLSEERQEFVAPLKSVISGGVTIAVARWFTWYINGANNNYLTIGIPIIDNSNSSDSVLNYYRQVIKSDKVILSMLRSSSVD